MSSPELSSELQSKISNCLLDILFWISLLPRYLSDTIAFLSTPTPRKKKAFTQSQNFEIITTKSLQANSPENRVLSSIITSLHGS